MPETELKLLLPGIDPSRVADQLARHPLLRRRSRVVQDLHNVYYDTPDQALRQQKVALRVRRLRASAGSEAATGERWILTLKTAGTSVGGLSQRGEWEADLPDGTPQRAALLGTPWDGLDPEGQLWPQLTPCFVTTCTRTLWQVRQRDRSHIEVALDVGEIVAGGRRLPLCELELELVAGPVEALYALARRLAESVAVLPGQASKAERGYALAAQSIDKPRRAQPVRVAASLGLPAAAAVVMSEMWDQTLRNTATWAHSPSAEALHQARVGWRRLRAMARLLRPVLGPPPEVPALRGFWQATGPVRELDVMRGQTLPSWASGYAASNAERASQWANALVVVSQARETAASVALQRLSEPACGVDWLAWGAWIAGLSTGATAVAADASAHTAPAPDPWPAWLRRRLKRQHRRLKRLNRQAGTDTERHEARLLAKRLRYAAEAWATVLPKRAAERWVRAAIGTQEGEGARRDLLQCVAWLDRLAVAPEVSAYMRGVAQGVLSR